MPKAVTMWEFSWLLRRAGREAEYAHTDRILDGLVERGYDCVRIDAFPHLIAAGDGPFSVAPQPDHFMWGPHGAPVPVVDPAGELIAFIRACRERGISVGLSSWFNDDADHLRMGISSPEGLARVWSATLERLDDAGVLDALEYVDLCNEFPLDDWLPAVHDDIFGRKPGDEHSVPGQAVEGGWSWSTAQRMRVQDYFRAIDGLRARWPQLRYTVSYAPVSESIFDLDSTTFDLIETHVWLSSNVPEFAALTNFSLDEHGFPGAWQKQVDSLDEVYWPDRERWHRELREQMLRWTRYRDTNAGRPLWTTEGWSHILLDDFTSPAGRSSWSYVRSVAEFAVPTAVELGWEGICTSNFSQPHFPGLWADVAWHRRMTDIIRAGG